jgi:hypothetical protein
VQQGYFISVLCGVLLMGDKPATFRILSLTKQKSSVSLFVSNQGQKEVEWGSIRITYLVDHTTA